MESEIVEGFLKDLPLQIEAVREALEERNFTEVQEKAHSIKGASATIQAEALRAIALDLERAAGTEDADAMHTIFAEMRSHFEMLKKEMCR